MSPSIDVKASADAAVGTRDRTALFLLFWLGLAIRSAMGLWGHSGENKPPMFGDFEAQRHWMEITLSLPLGDWYRTTAINDLLYWGLDYPPLTAYVSWIFGCMSQYIYPALTQLTVSRGHESVPGKTFMRASVLLCDALIFLPAIVGTIYSMMPSPSSRHPGQPPMMTAWKSSLFYWILAAFLCPSSLLIDHGHFQYNGVCIGLTFLAIRAILHDQDVLGSILFCLSLNFKQMALYYSPVFFFCLLRKCYEKSLSSRVLGFVHLCKIGLTVIISFTVLWMPFCVYASPEETCVSSLLHVLSRQFPFSRGIFEDKVANLWYVLSVIIDIRHYFSIASLAQLSMLFTIILILPIAIDLLRRPVTPIRLILSLLNCSMAFFLASFQVHEKSLLLSLLPAMMLLDHEPLLVCWFQLLGAFTMFPLILRDQLRIAHFAICILFISIWGIFLLVRGGDTEQPPTMLPSTTTTTPPTTTTTTTSNDQKQVNIDIGETSGVTVAATGSLSGKVHKIFHSNEYLQQNIDDGENKQRTKASFRIAKKRFDISDINTRSIQAPQRLRDVAWTKWEYLKMFFVMVSLVGMILLHGMEVFVKPPVRYPDLYPALFSIYGASNLVVVYVLGVARQWYDP